MSVAVVAHPRLLRPVRRFFVTPKGILLVLLGVITLLALPGQGPAEVAPAVLGAMAAAALVDMAIVRLSQNTWIFPSGALLSGMIVALVLRPQEPWIVPIATSILAITSKRLWRSRRANIFNPAALALVISSVLFGSSQSWWGALPDLGWAGVPLLLMAGLFISDRINKLPLVLAFLGTYFALFTAASFVGDPIRVAETFRAPDLHAVLFFAFFMVDDPPTCPVRYKDQATFGFLVAATCYSAFRLFGWVYFLPAGLLAGNAWEAWRRRSRRSPVAHAPRSA